MTFLARAMLFAAAMMFSASAAREHSVYVFYPLPSRPAAVQQKIDELCPGMRVMVFGRYRDFMEKAVSDSPDIVITMPQIIPRLYAYKTRLTGLRRGSSEEPYVLLSIDKGVDVDSLPRMVIGAVDVFGRTNTEEFVAGMLKKPQVRLNRVTKIEDLLPMMIFNKARAVFVREQMVAYFRKTTNLKLAVTTVPDCSAGIVTCAVRLKGPADVLDVDIRRISKKITDVLEIDQWQPMK